MSEITNESIAQLVSSTEQLLAMLPVLANAPSGESTEGMINYSDVVGFGDTSDPAISHIDEIRSYEPVYLIKTNDYIVGGANGVANLQARALVGRDNYLKKLIDDLKAQVDEIDLSVGGEDSQYTELLNRLNSLDATVFERRTLQLERQYMVTALAMKAAEMPAAL